MEPLLKRAGLEHRRSGSGFWLGGQRLAKGTQLDRLLSLKPGHRPELLALVYLGAAHSCTFRTSTHAEARGTPRHDNFHHLEGAGFGYAPLLPGVCV
jgi:hypothetical protein